MLLLLQAPVSTAAGAAFMWLQITFRDSLRPASGSLCGGGGGIRVPSDGRGDGDV